MNPLIQSMGTPQFGNPMSSLSNIFRLLKSGNPEQIAMNLMQQNPQFKAFIEANKGKSPEQVAQQYGVNLDQMVHEFK